MKEKGKIKVIKRGEIRESTPDKRNEQRTKRAAARGMVSTVSNWVSDFQAKKSDGAKIAFENLFTQTPRPRES